VPYSLDEEIKALFRVNASNIKDAGTFHGQRLNAGCEWQWVRYAGDPAV
jgi:hypothetical protein